MILQRPELLVSRYSTCDSTVAKMYLASPLPSLTESSPRPPSQITYGADMTPEELCDLLISTAVAETERYKKQLKSLGGEIKNLIAAIRSAQDVEGKRLQSAKVRDVFVELFNLLEQYAPAWYTQEHHRRATEALEVLRDSPSHRTQIRAKRRGASSF